MIGMIVTALLKEHPTVRMLAQLLCGLFLVYTAVRPLPMLRLPSLSGAVSYYSGQAEKAVKQGEKLGDETLRKSIKDRTCAYILDKAQWLEADLQVEVELSDEDIPVPKTVSITGKVSPYAKEKLSEMMEKELGIKVENQKWN
jgi:hypothetical protein